MNGAAAALLALLETAALAGLAVQTLVWRRSLRRLEALPTRPVPEADGQGIPGERCWILVAARDEAHHVEALLDALEPARQAGARLVWVDDGSVDDGRETLRGGLRRRGWTQATLLERPARGKPQALADGLDEVLTRADAGDRVLFTDADTRPRPGWLPAHAAALTGADLACGRVLLHVEGGTERQRRRRRFENAVSDLQCALGCLAGSPRYARGANWSAKVEALRRVEAPAILRRLASGDDVHVVRALGATGVRATYIPAAAVAVETDEGWRPAAAARQARRRYGKLRDLPAREILRQAGLMAALLLQPLLLMAGVARGSPWVLAPALALAALAWAARDTLARGLRRLDEPELAKRPLGPAAALALHALRHGLAGALAGYRWRDRPGEPGRERTP